MCTSSPLCSSHGLPSRLLWVYGFFFAENWEAPVGIPLAGNSLVAEPPGKLNHNLPTFCFIALCLTRSQIKTHLRQKRRSGQVQTRTTSSMVIKLTWSTSQEISNIFIKRRENRHTLYLRLVIMMDWITLKKKRYYRHLALQAQPVPFRMTPFGCEASFQQIS